MRVGWLHSSVAPATARAAMVVIQRRSVRPPLALGQEHITKLIECAPSAAPSGRTDRSRIRSDAMSHWSGVTFYRVVDSMHSRSTDKLNQLRYSPRQSTARALRPPLYGSLAPSRLFAPVTHATPPLTALAAPKAGL